MEATATRSVRAIRRRKSFLRNYQLYLLVAVPLLYFIVFKYIPMYGAQIAFRDYTARGGFWGSEWVGLKHFVSFFRSFQFRRIILNTFGLSLYSLFAGFPIPILLAIALNNARTARFKKTVQMVTYAPHFISTVVMCGIIIQFLSPNVGIVNQVIKALGFEPIGFMGQSQWFKTVFVLTDIWQQAGWASIIYLSALASVSTELHEAAIVDGATIFQRNLHIDFPAILPVATILLILAVGRLMTVSFEKVLLLQNALNLEASEVIQTFVYKRGIAWQPPNYSFASAVGFFNSIVNFALLVSVNAFSKRTSGNSLW
jgi:putative aldouronate transport system permease protein